MKYSKLEKIAEKHGWTKTHDSEYWMTYTKNDITIEISKHQIDNDITLWSDGYNTEISLNYELDFINACIELGQTPPADRKDEKRFMIPLPWLVTTDGKTQYLTNKDGYFFASRKNKKLKQTWTEEELQQIPEQYRQYANEVELLKGAEDSIIRVEKNNIYKVLKPELFNEGTKLLGKYSLWLNTAMTPHHICFIKDFGTKADIKYGTSNSLWFGYNPESQTLSLYCNAYGGMCWFVFNENDLIDQPEGIDRDCMEFTISLIKELQENGIIESITPSEEVE